MNSCSVLDQIVSKRTQNVSYPLGRQDAVSAPLGTVAARACCALATSNRPQRQQSLRRKRNGSGLGSDHPASNMRTQNNTGHKDLGQDLKIESQRKHLALCCNAEKKTSSVKLGSVRLSAFNPSKAVEQFGDCGHQ